MSASATPWGEPKRAFGYACASYGRDGVAGAHWGGRADLATDHEFTLHTRVNCGSIAKLVTAHLVTRLWSGVDERQRLRLGTLLPGIPGPIRDATVEDCLTHTTGLWDFRSLIPLFGERSTFAYGVSDAIELAVRQSALVPGFERQYSNTNYLLLGLAVERAAGARLQDLVTGWLGTDVGNFVGTPRAVVPGRARGYEVLGDGGTVEFGSFVDGRGSTNFWAHGRELATLAERVTAGYTNHPVYGGLALGDGVFYAAGQDGGFRAGMVIDSGRERCHVALTNDPGWDPLEILGTHAGLWVGRPGRAAGTDEMAVAPAVPPDGTFACGSLGVRLSLATAADGALVVSVEDRVLGRLGRERSDSFSDGHLTVFTRNETIFLSINHAQGIPLDPVAP